MGAERHHDSPRLAAAANRQKKPRPAQVWSGRRLPFVTPVPRSIKGQAPEQRQTSLWRKCEAAPKRRPRTSIRGQVGHDAHPEGRHSKDGHPQPQPASWQAFGQDKILSRIPEPRPETHMPSDGEVVGGCGLDHGCRHGAALSTVRLPRRGVPWRLSW